MEAYKNFKGTRWQEEINVNDFNSKTIKNTQETNLFYKTLLKQQSSYGKS
jgi:hypothetical protein